MKRAVVFVFIGLCAVSALSVAEGNKDSKPPATESPAGEFDASTIHDTTTTTTAKTTTTTTAKTTTTTTAKTTTTTAKPTTTTAKPTTTTAKPTTTTAKPTTTTAKPTTKPTTTTAKPTTTKPTTTTAKPTTTKPTTTTPKPTPPPTPTSPTTLRRGNYTLTNDKKQLCLMAQMSLEIRLATPQANGTFLVQPNKTKVEGGCQENTANLTLTFTEGFITFMFNKNTSANSVYVDALSFSLSYPFGRGGNGVYKASNTSMTLFQAKVGHSYSCRNESVFMGKGLFLDVSEDRMQGFNLTKSNDFGTPDACPADHNDYRVAIAVGVTLLVLIVIVVVAYLLGRRRRADGYQSL